MTDPFLQPPFIYGIAGAALLIIILVTYLYLRSRRPSGAAQNPDTRNGRLAYQPEIRPIPEVRPAAAPRPAQKSPSFPLPKETDLFSGRSDIGGSLNALIEKYSLDQFTIATSDGLVFASGDSDSAQTDAARYCEIFMNDPLSETPGVVLSKVTHKGSDLILIIRSGMEIPEPIRTGIERDTKDILNRWI